MYSMTSALAIVLSAAGRLLLVPLLFITKKSALVLKTTSYAHYEAHD